MQHILKFACSLVSLLREDCDDDGDGDDDPLSLFLSQIEESDPLVPNALSRPLLLFAVLFVVPFISSSI